jgi:CBS domain-containing protein
MMGSGGRDELLIRSAVYHALVYEDPDKEEAEKVDAFFKELANRVSHALRVCGFLESPQNVLAQQPGWCLSLSGMKKRFSDFIQEPVTNHVYSARDAFDFQPLDENCPLAAELTAHINVELMANPEFIRHMARDSFLNQPPRTIFSGYVVDMEGIRRDELEIKSHALLPLVDVGRVLALEAGSHFPTATHQRLAEAAEKAGSGTPMGNLLKEASEGFLVAQYSRISQGLRAGTDGAVIHPAELEPETRTLLITTFRTILEIFESTAKRFDLNWRD